MSDTNGVALKGTKKQKPQYKMELVGIYYSPWSIKVMWVLAHHNLPYKYTAYMPKVSEPKLRYRTGKWSGNLTVPVVFCKDRKTKTKSILMESLDISYFADEVGSNTIKLFPTEDNLKEEIEEWNKKADSLLGHMRIVSMIRSANDEEVKQEALPGWAKSMGFVGSYIYSSAVNYVLNKYKMPSSDAEENEREAKKYLEEIRQQLAKGKCEYILGDRFTFADIAVVCALQLVNPMSDLHWELKPGQRRIMTSSIHEEYSDVIAWRDSIVNNFFRVRQPVEL